MQFWVIQTLNSLALGGLLFLLSSGFSLIFGLMRIANLTHGALFMLGAYIGVSILKVVPNLWLAALLGGLAVAALGGLLERFLLRQLAGNILGQVLVTLGADLARVRGQVITLLSGEAGEAGEPPAQERVILQDMPAAVAGGPAFRAQQPAELVRVVPLVRELVRRGGYRVMLISLEVWSGWVHLRYALLPAEPAEAPPLVDLPIRWRLGDDLDTAYQLVGGGSAGDPLLRIYHLSFQPAPPSDANTLTITVQDQDGADLAAVEVPLAGAS